MNDTIKNTIKLFVAFCIIVFFSTLIVGWIVFSSLIPTYIQENNIIKEVCDNTETTIKTIERTALNISQNNEYVLHKYDCTQFSADLVKALKIVNISSYCVFGLVRDGEYVNALHTWVEVIIDNKTYPYEATGGYFIDNQTYSMDYKILKRGFCL